MTPTGLRAVLLIILAFAISVKVGYELTRNAYDPYDG